jgi:hypothetical protein
MESTAMQPCAVDDGSQLMPTRRREPMILHKIPILSAAALLAFLLAAAPNVAAQFGDSAPVQTSADNLPLSSDEIIRRFAANESQFKIERGNYTYSQSVLVEASLADGSLNGKYERNSDIVFTPEGKRYEKDTYAPVSTLKVIDLSPQDHKDLEDIQPFVLTTEDLPKYDVKYDGKERIDALDTYRFSVAPKKIEKNQRYFQGTIWVDDRDFAIVKSDGKAVPDIVEKGRENRFPRFVTYRENIEGSSWFPTYTRADDTIRFSTGDVRIRMTVRYRNYKRFGSTVRVGPSREIDLPPDSEPSR